MANESKSGVLEVVVSFLIGATAGFVLGILFAPASGKETRKKIGDEIDKGKEKAKEGLEKGIHAVREKTEEGIEAIKEFVEKKKGTHA
ncbi:MAG: YtxH domain-containing protein [Candidatus Aminicenantales bacterium]